MPEKAVSLLGMMSEEQAMMYLQQDAAFDDMSESSLKNHWQAAKHKILISP
jgi:hypothetical protein